jgi:hypothetical protein
MKTISLNTSFCAMERFFALLRVGDRKARLILVQKYSMGKQMGILGRFNDLFSKSFEQIPNEILIPLLSFGCNPAAQTLEGGLFEADRDDAVMRVAAEEGLRTYILPACSPGSRGLAAPGFSGCKPGYFCSQTLSQMRNAR